MTTIPGLNLGVRTHEWHHNTQKRIENRTKQNNRMDNEINNNLLKLIELQTWVSFAVVKVKPSVLHQMKEILIVKKFNFFFVFDTKRSNSEFCKDLLKDSECCLQCSKISFTIK